MKKITVLLFMLLLIISMVACGKNIENDSAITNENSNAIDKIVEMVDTNSVEVSEDDFGAKSAIKKDDFTVEEMLKFAIQDEYLARQEYELIIDAYGNQNPFTNIIKAEKTHIELLKGIYETYEYTLPEDTAIDHAVLPESLDAAFDIGVQAEIDNIAMYEKFLEIEMPNDIYDVFVALRDASKSHLSAFQKGASK